MYFAWAFWSLLPFLHLCLLTYGKTGTYAGWFSTYPAGGSRLTVPLSYDTSAFTCGCPAGQAGTPSPL
jgi:hypothetical protein